MPVINIQSLPFDPPIDIGRALQAVSADFSAAMGIAERFISLAWSDLPAGHYCCSGALADRQPAESHPLLVQLLIPDLHTPENGARMLEVLADSLSRHTGVARSNIFIELRLAHSGMVFDDGLVVEWEN